MQRYRVMLLLVLLSVAVVAYAAIDSANKRANMLGAGPAPDGTIDAADRQQMIEMRFPTRRMARVYSGFLAGGGPTPTPTPTATPTPTPTPTPAPTPPGGARSTGVTAAARTSGGG